MTMKPPFQQSLRCVINLGNPLLAQAHGKTAIGVSVDLADALAKHWGLSCELLIVNNAREAVAALEAKQADLGFLAVDPARAQLLQFTNAYLEIEGCYLVKAISNITHIDAVDRPGHSVVVGLGSAYDLFLSRHLKHAALIKAESSKAVVPTFVHGSADVAAGVKEQLLSDMQTHSDLRMLEGNFMVIKQALVLHQDSGTEALAEVQAFVNACLTNGFLAQAMQRHRVSGARLVQPPH